MLTNHKILLCQEGSARYLAAHLGNDPDYWHQHLGKDRRRPSRNREFHCSHHRRPGSFSGYSFYAFDNLSQYAKGKQAGLKHVDKTRLRQWYWDLGSVNSFAYVGAEFSFGGELQVLQAPSYNYIITPELATTLAADLIVKADLCKKHIFDYERWQVVETQFSAIESKVMKLLADSGKSSYTKGDI